MHSIKGTNELFVVVGVIVCKELLVVMFLSPGIRCVKSPLELFSNQQSYTTWRTLSIVPFL